MTAEPIPLLDVNVLIALAWPSHVHHGRARRWFGDRVNPDWATTALTELAFVRLSTNRVVTGRDLLLADALEMLGRIRSLRGHQYVADRSSLLDPTIDLSAFTSGRQSTDAHLTNLCATTGMVLATMDASLLRVLSPTDRRHVALLP